MNLSWTSTRLDDIDKELNEQKKEMRSNLSVFYPEGAYGQIKSELNIKDVIVKNATIWTSSDQGKLLNSDILFINGKVKKIKRDLKIPKNVIVINGTDKHITPGLIDCHSHSAAFSINEGTVVYYI